MEENTEYKALPAKTEMSMYLSRLGRTCFNMCIATAVVADLSMLALVVPILIEATMWLLVVCALLLTLFTLIAYAPGLFDSLSSSGALLTGFSQTFGWIWKIFAPISLAFAVASVLFLVFDKQGRHGTRITAAVITAVIELIFVIIKAVISL